MSLPAYLFETFVDKKISSISNIMQFIFLILQEPFFKSKNKEDTADICSFLMEYNKKIHKKATNSQTISCIA